MSGTKQRPFEAVSLTLVVSFDLPSDSVVLTTWGIVAGRYGSMGRVAIPVASYRPPQTKTELASLVLTALYGLDYDL